MSGPLKTQHLDVNEVVFLKTFQLLQILQKIMCNVHEMKVCVHFINTDSYAQDVLNYGSKSKPSDFYHPILSLIFFRKLGLLLADDFKSQSHSIIK